MLQQEKWQLIPSHVSSPSSSRGSYNSGLLILASLMVVTACWIFVHRWNQRNRKAPKTWPLLGTAVEQLMNFDRFHDWLLTYLDQTPTFVASRPFMTYTFTADPANVEHILRSNFTNYPKGEIFRSTMEELLGDGIFNVDGELWRSQRKTASFGFTAKSLRDYSTASFRDYTLKLSAILSQASVQNKQVDMQGLLMRMTLDSICKVGFGVEMGTLDSDLPDNRFAQAFDAVTVVVTFRFVDLFWKMKKLLKVGSEAVLDRSITVIDDFIYSVIRRRKAEIEQARQQITQKTTQEERYKDLLSRFIEFGRDPENNLTEKSLRDIVLNFAFAGRDTTASTLSWAIYMIMTHDDVADKLYSELKSFEQDSATEKQMSLLLLNRPEEDDSDTSSFDSRVEQFAHFLTHETLGKLDYLHAVISETLRLFPPVPQNPKGIIEDDVLPDGTKVKAGNLIFYVPYSMGRMKHIWGPDAASFKPERWLKNGVFQSVSPYKFTAFQAGPRICLGKDYAYLQMKMALAILGRFFKFSLVAGHEVKYKMTALLSMAHGLPLTAARRS